MVWIAAKPQGTWGHQGQGLAPSTVARLRQQFGVASLIRRPGGCTTAAFRFNVGLEKDPTIQLRQELLITWLQVVASSTVPARALYKVWKGLKIHLADAARRWHRVQRPMGAVVATLLDLGWDPFGPTR